MVNCLKKLQSTLYISVELQGILYISIELQGTLYISITTLKSFETVVRSSMNQWEIKKKIKDVGIQIMILTG
jgi:hypothetical protein